MIWLNKRWILLCLGVILGVIIGIYLGFRYAGSDQDRLYLDTTIGSSLIARGTISKAENQLSDRIIDDHQILLRSAFIGLVEIHREGLFPDENERILEHLTEINQFIQARPEGFIDQQFFSADAIIDKLNSGDEFHPDDIKVTNDARKQLQEAFDYVDSLTSSTEY